MEKEERDGHIGIFGDDACRECEELEDPGACRANARDMGQGPMTRLFVRSGASILPIGIESVIRFEAWGDYVTAHTAKSRHVRYFLNRSAVTRFTRSSVH